MGNTCGTCAFDNRGTEVDMKESKQNGGMKRPVVTTKNVGRDNEHLNDYDNQPAVNLNDTAEFLEPPEYQCDAVMVRNLTTGIP